MKRVIRLDRADGEMTVGWMFGNITLDMKLGQVRLSFGMDTEGAVKLRDALTAAIAGDDEGAERS